MKAALLKSSMVLLAVIMLVGCNTLHGVGKDIEKVGEAIRKS